MYAVVIIKIGKCIFNWQLTSATMTINDTGDAGNGQWLKYLACRCLWSRKYLNIGLRGHNNVCIMAEGEPVPYDPTLIGLSETSTAFTCAETHAPVCNGRTPAFYLPQLLW